VLFCEPRVLELLVVVVDPVLALLPPMPDPVEPVVCAPAQANATSKTGAANHVRFIVKFPSASECVSTAALLPSEIRILFGV